MQNDYVILVDERNREVGTAGKKEVHTSGALHRAFSVLLFDTSGRQLIQRRAPGKYHTGGLWSNACCSHPRPQETVDAAVDRRVREELGVGCDVRHVFDMKYRSAFTSGLVEHEYDQVFVGTYDGPLQPNPDEVAETRLVDAEHLMAEIETSPSMFTPWFRLLAREVFASRREPVTDRRTQTILEPDGTVATFYFPDVSRQSG